MRLTRTLILFVGLSIVLVMAALSAQRSTAQSVDLNTLNAQIKQLKDLIKSKQSTNPPPNLLTEHTQLLMLLQQKQALLLQARSQVPAGASQLIVQAIDDSLKSAEVDMQEVVEDLRKDVSLPPSTATLMMTPTPTPAPTPTNSELLFKNTVAMLEKTDLSKAAAPEVAKSATSTPPCAVVLGNLRQFSKVDTGICGMADDIVTNRKDKTILLRQDKFDLYPILISKLLKTNATESYVTFVTEAQEARTDQQVGAGSGSSGTTSLTVKGGVPYLFGLAVENGAATQSQSGTTITYRVNPGGMVNLLGKKGFITGFQESENDPFQKLLRKTSLGFTFDTSRGVQPGVFTGDKQQLSAFSARVEFVNDRDPRLKKYERTWESFVSTELVKLGNAASAATLALNDNRTAAEKDTFKDPALQAWLNQTNGAITDALAKAGPGVSTVDVIAAVIRQRADLVPVELVSADTKQAITVFAKQYSHYVESKDELLKKIARGKIFTLEYTNNRGVNAPDISNFNFIAATGTGGRVDLTANGSFTFFNKLPALSVTTPRPGRIRDFQFAGQLTKQLKLGDGQIDFWFSGRYERLVADASTVAGTTMPNTKGDIAVGQVGLNIPIKGLGIKFPVSVTFANRTELIKEKEVRGNIGFTMNWDTLFSKLKPF
ncbi:MAG TPA: hypothetical protein VK582_00400 [Pyrinomonadaceae bacterium]|nr:hypothetical protein [Pyrinomonadaceae bacterium]